MASSSSAVPDDSSPWVGLSHCKVHGLINATSVLDSCAITAPSYPGTAGGSDRLWLRATTNFSGCGTWTATPNTASCGDAQQMMISVSAP